MYPLRSPRETLRTQLDLFGANSGFPGARAHGGLRCAACLALGAPRRVAGASTSGPPRGSAELSEAARGSERRGLLDPPSRFGGEPMFFPRRGGDFPLYAL